MSGKSSKVVLGQSKFILTGWLALLLSILILSCGGTVYDIKLKDMEGREVTLEDFRNKDGLVVYVWSGTCVGHTEDLRKLEDIYAKVRRKVAIVSVAIMMDPKDVRKFLEDERIKPSFPVLADPKGEFAKKVTLLFLPATILIDQKGKVKENMPRLAKGLILKLSGSPIGTSVRSPQR